MFWEYIYLPTTILLLLACFSLIFLAWWNRYSERPVKLQVKDYIHLEVPKSALYLTGGIIILIFLHQGAQNWAIKKLEKKSNSAPDIKPLFVSEGEWECAKGITAYNQKDYDKAEQLFSEIDNLSGPAFVRWKFYEAMCFFRKEQYKKIVKINEPDPEVIESILSRLGIIVQKWRDDILYTDAKYWYAQCHRFFRNDDETAFKIFQELLSENSDNSNFKWREGCIYYSALILLNKNDDKSKQKAICMLNELLQKYRNNFIQPVEMGQDSYRVYWVVKVLARERGINELCDITKLSSESTLCKNRR